MVAGFIELLESEHGDRLPPEGHEYIASALDGTLRMRALIQGLLAYARVGTRGGRKIPVACDSVLETVLIDLKAVIAEAKAEVVHSPLPVVTADPVQMRQLLQNLVSNAIKFRGEVPPRVEVEAHEEGDDWLFSIKDNGIGFDTRYSDKIFAIFQRLHPRDAYPGTGIGLALCKKIVERHGGRIWTESTPGVGTTFYFTLPIVGIEGDATIA
jgi:light-regulated signal transduction histidine kinase (bacteriophytochrome)